MKRLFKISAGEHGRGSVLVKWQPEGNLLATAGITGNLRYGYPTRGFGVIFCDIDPARAILARSITVPAM